MNLFRSLAVVISGCVMAISLVNCSASVSGDAPVAANISSLPGYAETPVLIDNGDYKIPGILVMPVKTSGKKIPVLVLLHGTASQKNEVGGLYQRLATYLADAGYASLRIDFAGTGDSQVDYRHYNLTSAVRDVAAAMDFLAAQPELDVERMGLVGFSQGGLIAQLVAAQDVRIQSLVAWSSAVSDGNNVGAFSPFFEQYYAEAKANDFAVVKFPWRAEPLNFGLQWFDEIKVNNSLEKMKSYKGKLLAVAGSVDPVVPYAASVSLVDAAGSSDAEFILIKGADHVFNVLGANGLAEDQSIAEELLATTVSWVERNL